MIKPLLLFILCRTAAVVVVAADAAPGAVAVAQAAVNKAASNVDGALEQLRKDCAALPNTENPQAAQARRELLAQRLQSLTVNLQQSSSSQSWTPGITCFSAMSDAERKRVLMQPSVVSKLMPANATILQPVNVSRTAAGVATSQSSISPIDWRSVGGRSFVTPIRDQGYCGSCYIFAPAAAIESQMMINRLGGVSPGAAQKINLSEQQLLNCAPNVAYGRKQPWDPCDGGWPTVAFDWTRLYGLVGENQNPYIQNPPIGQWPACALRPLVHTNAVVLNTGYKTVVDWFTPMAADGNVNNIKAELLLGPLVIAFNANGAFMTYKQGVFSCRLRDSQAPPNHAMLLVGWARASGSTPAHWTIKNSWGTQWGEQGYARVNMNTNNDCGLTRTLVQRATIRAVTAG